MRKTLTVMAITAVMAISTVTMASAGVERYQFTDVVIDIDSVNTYEGFWHDSTFRHNPCEDEWTVSHAIGSQGDETIADISIDGNHVTYASDYDETTYV